MKILMSRLLLAFGLACGSFSALAQSLSAPDGHYYVVFFTSTFERDTVEGKVILNLSKGEWDVEGYFMSPIANAKAP